MLEPRGLFNIRGVKLGERTMGRKAFDLYGQKFGRLTVLHKNPSNPRGYTQWVCKCDCGNEVVIIGPHLKNGNTKSCGCLQREINIKRSTTHGLAGTQVYEAWCGAKASAKKRGLQFNLEPFDICIPEFCPVLGIRIERNTKQGPSDCSPSLDRVFPERGYVKGNIRIISQRANRIKNDATAEELEKVLDDSRRFEIFAYA
jgi:hypothetical protein